MSIAAVAIREKLNCKIGSLQPKVKRYWPGKAPDWAVEADEDGGANSADNLPSSSSSDLAADPRLRRLAISRIDEARSEHRKIRQAEVLSAKEEEEDIRPEDGKDGDEEEEDEDERRRRIKEKRRQIEEAGLVDIEEEQEQKEESESESEYESETDSDEETTWMAMVKPVFVPKSDRETIAERERLEEEERAMEENERNRIENRKIETRRILVEEITKDALIHKNLETTETADVDTDDELNEAEEYDLWTSREISRNKRDRREADQAKSVHKNTNEETEPLEMGNSRPQKRKRKQGFMQRYYHPGPFYQGEADIYSRDFSEPTGVDKMDKTVLPKVMQVKNFGKRGRTKWTHLVNEDTSERDNRFVFVSKYYAKMAAMDSPIAKPRGSKRLKVWDDTM